MKRLYIFAFFVFLISCKTEDSKPEKAENKEDVSLLEPKEVLAEDSLSVAVYNFDGLEPLLNKKDDKTYIINFWATWCKPCIKELPYFEKINAEYKNKKVEVILVSMDFPKMYKSHLIPFIEKRGLQSRVVALDDPKQNTWIPKVNEDWSGAIPATLIYNKDKREFYERSFEYEELENTVQQFLK
ncbi:redoxin domain-containing protein [Leptobacterium flavescens]|uniref:Redoxin domain-containing protein n=1 Tax=Leptobacterium flavescens TaxID=472055 RepID=A0A6P0UKB3_9FLAO|nr:TlpA disulfide reductase family protein [Leptobacterium flavescens]NER12328.1 redoxin domain-containing protein [Leptobacterium flavescens]